MESSAHVNLSVDFGDGRNADVELGEAGQLWIASGSGFDLTDVWVKTDGTLIDLRVRIRRTQMGIEVSVDRGGDQQRWWQSEASPRLAIAIDSLSGIARAVAGVGNGQEFQQIMLGETTIR